MAKPKVYEVLQWASSFLEKNDRDPHIAEVLMLHHLDVSYGQYIMMMREEMTDEQYGMYQHHVNAHVHSGVPVQHLTGYAHFYGHRFSVNENVIIPRCDTEEMIEEHYVMYQHYVNAHVHRCVPVQHLTVYAHFYCHRFSVNENVLIPRCETEELVEHVITYVKEHYDDESIRIVDVGTGSG